MILSFEKLKQFDVKRTIGDQRLVLVGGCFDILHIGHIHFLQHAKKQGDYLVVLLESDRMIKQKKGINRPINTQTDRAAIVAQLKPVDAVICLPDQTINATYLQVTKRLKPAIIATTSGDPYRMYKEACASAVHASVVDVIKREQDVSTSRLAKLLQQETV